MRLPRPSDTCHSSSAFSASPASPRPSSPLQRVLQVSLLTLPLLVPVETRALKPPPLAVSPPADSPALRVRGDTAVELALTAARWEFDGPFALRHLDIRLRNNGPRAAEATLELPLGAQEQLRGFALDVNGQLVDAVPVERVQARVAFESTVRQNVDPALVEKDEGNRYRIRVFPVPAGGQRLARITVATLAERAACGWEHRLSLPRNRTADAAVPWTLTSTSAPTADAWPRATGAKEAALWQRQSSDAAAVPATVCLPAPAGLARMSARLGDGTRLTWVELPAAVQSQPVPQPERLELVWDASLGQGERRAELALLRAYLLSPRTVPMQVTLSELRHQVARSRLVLAPGDEAAVDALLDRLATLPDDGASGLQHWRPAQDVQAVLLFSGARGTWPSAEGLARPDVPVHVISSHLSGLAAAQALARRGGRVLDLSTLDTATALLALTRQDSQRLALGPRHGNWHAPSLLVTGGVLRACHISGPEDGVEPSGLPVQALDAQGRPTERDEPLPAGDKAQGTAPAGRSALAFWCGQWWMQDLEADPLRHRSLMAAVGQRFGVTGPETSLLVLERAADYVRHGITPPGEVPEALKQDIERSRQAQASQRAAALARHRTFLEDGWAERTRWWQATYPKDMGKFKPDAPKEMPPPPVFAETRPMPAPAPAPAPAAAAIAPQVQAAPRASTNSPSPGSRRDAAAPSPPATPAIGMTLQTVQLNEPYTAELRAATTASAAYQRYLDLRHRYGQSPAFFFDVAERLFELKDSTRAVQVLSNIVALMPSEAAALRPVAYRLQQANEHRLALDLLRRVAMLAPDEPTSWRDLGLALAQVGDCTAAMEQLAHVALTPWDPRFRDVSITALGELQDVSQRCKKPLPERVPASLRRSLPIDLRVVLKWNLNDTDIDLHVTDPTGETTYFGNRFSRQGGRMSEDFVAGYGPEEFILRKPIPGTYEVHVNYYGSARATVVRGAIVQVDLQTGFGTPQRRSTGLTMRLLEQAGLVMVGRFTVGEDGQLKTKR